MRSTIASPIGVGAVALLLAGRNGDSLPLPTVGFPLSQHPHVPLKDATGAQLTGVVDDDGDGQPEVNTLAEIAIYIAALKSNDKHGNPVAVNPVLIRGGRIWHESQAQPSGVDSFEYHGTGIKTESSHPFSINHNVLDKGQALGASGCANCHRFGSGHDTPVLDRRVLVDPWGTTGNPIYKTVRELTGISPN